MLWFQPVLIWVKGSPINVIWLAVNWPMEMSGVSKGLSLAHPGLPELVRAIFRCGHLIGDTIVQGSATSHMVPAEKSEGESVRTNPHTPPHTRRPLMSALLCTLMKNHVSLLLCDMNYWQYCYLSTLRWQKLFHGNNVKLNLFHQRSINMFSLCTPEVSREFTWNLIGLSSGCEALQNTRIKLDLKIRWFFIWWFQC